MTVIQRVICAKLLGVWLQEDFGMKEHVNNLMLLCNQCSYLITQLKRQVLSQEPLQDVFDAIIQLLYRVYFMRTCVARIFKLCRN